MAVLQVKPDTFVDGTLDAHIHDNNGAPASVLEASVANSVHVFWTIPVSLGALLGAGNWNVAVYIRDFDGGTPVKVFSNNVAQTPGAFNYSTDVAIPAGSFPNNPGNPNSGAYEIIVIVTFNSGAGIGDISGILRFDLVRIG